MDEEALGQFEHRKFADRRPFYEESLREILSLGYPPEDLIHHFPAFAGHLTLLRFLSLYEAYKQTLGIAGHIAEVGVFKGAGSLFFAKMLQIFEPDSLTLVHGFDWFQGAKVTEEEKFVVDGECCEDYQRVLQLVRAQHLEPILHLHNMDVTEGLGPFFEEHAHLRFKLVFLDCGLHDVVAAGIRHFWPRLAPGGVLILDHYSHEFAPGEMRAVRELLPDIAFRSFRPGWMPAAYAIKPGAEDGGLT